MPAEKRNHFLDIDESDDDGSQGYDSEADQPRKGASKRRKLEHDDSDQNDSDEDEPLVADDDLEEENNGELEGGAEEDGEKPTNGNESKPEDSPESPSISRPLTRKNLVATEKAVKRSGVIYVSRVPPFMKPGTIRSIFEKFGKINRVYLSPEDAQTRSRRLQQGQNRKKNFHEGWLEFIRKIDAKKAVESLNGTTLGAIGMVKKKSYYRDDIWSLRYLTGFKWHNLTEQIATETAERQSRMRAEISKATRENKEFVRNIQKSKELDGIQAKAASKKNNDTETAERGVGSVGASKPEAKSLRKFNQAAVGKKASAKPSESVTRVLSQLF